MSADVKTTVEQGVGLEYFCTENTDDEWRTEVTGNYVSFDVAREALKHKSDWYSNKNNGCIYKSSF